jgi:hypothetical protein
MKTTSKDVQMRVEKPSRSLYRQDIHPVLASYFAEQGLTDAEISSRLHISRKTLYSWRKVHPELEEALRNSKERADAMVEAALFRKALQGDVSACIFYLCNRCPSRWARNGQVDVQITAHAEKGMSVEEIVRRYSDAYESTRGVQEQIAAHVGEEKTNENVAGILAEAIRALAE